MYEVAKAADTRRLYQQVADQIRNLIRSGQFEPGSRLPAERDLAQQIGVSRPSLREGLIALEVEGRVEIRMGSGVYVCASPPSADGPTGPMGESPSELMQARAVVESMVATLAAARMTPQAIETLRETLEAMRTEISAGHHPLEQDRLFHTTIAAQTGNSVLVRIVTELFDERHQPITAQIRTRYESSSTWMSAVVEHEAIVKAFEAGDPLLAQTMMRLHLEASRERWIET
jgi:GntR family transcriptional regulator, transcriptional repressor for pyruvate dehydrogenase complex